VWGGETEPAERKNSAEEEKDDTAEEELLVEAPSLQAFLSGQCGSAGAAAVVADRTKGASRSQACSSRGDDGSVSRLQQQLYGAIAANQFHTTRAAFVFFVGEDAAQPDGASKDEALEFISRTRFKVALTTLGLVLSPRERKALRKSLDRNDNKQISYEDFKAFIHGMGDMGGMTDSEGATDSEGEKREEEERRSGSMSSKGAGTDHDRLARHGQMDLHALMGGKTTNKERRRYCTCSLQLLHYIMPSVRSLQYRTHPSFLAHSLSILPNLTNLTNSLTHSLTSSVPPFLTPSLPPSLPPSLTH
jgi:hypothetical protein